MREFLQGIGDLGRGFRVWGTSPRLMLLGLLPAALVGALFLALVVGLAVALPHLVPAITPFADDWAPSLRSLVRAAIGAALLAVVVVVLVLVFAAVTLAVGDPFYERISGAVEQRLGNPPGERDRAFLVGIARAVADGLRLLVASLAVGLLAFLLGLVPLVGPVLAVLVGALLGGPLLTTELTGYAFEARGLRLADRRRMLRANRARALGFGAAAWLLFLVPVLAVLTMPAAVAGATVLSRAVLGERVPTGRARTELT